MRARYASTMDGWKAWQKGYRFGILLLIPPEPLRSRVNALRAAHDPVSAAAIDAHVSLTVPLPRAPTEERWAELETLAGGVASFTVTYGPARRFPSSSVVFLDIEPKHVLAELVATLESASLFEEAGPRQYPFTPHMTIAEFIPPDRTEPLLKQLEGTAPMGTFECAEVCLSVPDEAFRFSTQGRLALGA